MKKIPNGNHYVPDAETFLWDKPDYGKEEYELAQKYAKGNSVAIDVGAHVGFWTTRMAEDYARVLSFEALPDNLECLEENVKEAGYEDKVEVHGIAMGEEFGSIQLDDGDGDSLKAKATRMPSKIDITRQSIDLMLKKGALDADIKRSQSVDLIKINVGGAETEVIDGGIKTIKKYKPTIFVAVNDYVNSDFEDQLEPLGYEMVEDYKLYQIWQHEDNVK